MEHSIQAGRVGLMVDIIHLVPKTFILAVDTIQVAKLNGIFMISKFSI